MLPPVLIVGAGYTGSRVARNLRDLGYEVDALHSSDIDFRAEDAVAKLAARTREGCLVLHSVPSLEGGADTRLLHGLRGKARRLVYFSTTGVYGGAEQVDETTAVGPRNPREQARVATEQAVLTGPWRALVLRPAAIYGPGRGVHVSMAAGKYTMYGDGGNFISRIHVEDLAAIATAGLLSDLTGAYPVADETPCTSREIAEYCAARLGLPPPVVAPLEQVPETRRNNRRVNGRWIVEQLGLQLRYPGYREGIEASLEPTNSSSSSNPSSSL
jgi:nucleoside-diphosphate-sugar epimerase